MKIRVVRNNLGVVDSVYLNVGDENPSWASLPYDAAQKKFSPQTPIDQTLLSMAQAIEEWANLDLSDQEPEPVPLQPTWSYAKFEAAVTDTPLFAKSLTSTNANEFALLLATIRTDTIPAEKRLSNFAFSLNQVVLGLPEPLNEEELEQLNLTLKKCGFPFVLPLAFE